MTGEEVDPREPFLKKSFYLDMDEVMASIGLMDPKQGDLAAFQQFTDRFDNHILRAG